MDGENTKGCRASLRARIRNLPGGRVFPGDREPLGDEGSAKGEGRDPLDGRARGLQHAGHNPFRLHWWNVPRSSMRERTAPLTRKGRRWGAAPRGRCGGTPREQGSGSTRGDSDERVRDYARFCERTEKKRSCRLREEGREVALRQMRLVR